VARHCSTHRKRRLIFWHGLQTPWEQEGEGAKKKGPEMKRGRERQGLQLNHNQGGACPVNKETRVHLNKRTDPKKTTRRKGSKNPQRAENVHQEGRGRGGRWALRYTGHMGGKDSNGRRVGRGKLLKIAESGGSEKSGQWGGTQLIFSNKRKSTESQEKGHCRIGEGKNKYTQGRHDNQRTF